MIDEATLVLQRWKESDSLPSGMVFDAEHLDTTKLVYVRRDQCERNLQG